MNAFVKFILLLVYAKEVFCIDCENGLNSAECLRNEISKLRLDLRPVTAHLPANTKQYLPFGSLESDWNRLLQLESLLPEDHHLRQQLTRSFLLLVQAVREALEYQLSKTTTVKGQTDNAVTTKYQSTTDAPEFQPENGISADGYEVVIDSKTTPKIINEYFGEDVNVANGKEDFEAKLQEQVEETFNKRNEAIDLHDKSDETDKDTMETIVVTEEEINADQSEEKKVSVKELDLKIDSKEKAFTEEEISNSNSEKTEVREESGKDNKASVETFVASEENRSSKSEEKKPLVRKLDTIVDSSEENSESVGDFNLAKAEGLVGEDMREKDNDDESNENVSQNVDHEEKKESHGQHINPETSVEAVNDEVHQTTISTTTEYLSEINADINFPVINQDEIIENIPKEQEELDETPIESTEIDLDNKTSIEKETLNNSEHDEVMTTKSAHTTTEKSEEMIIENTKNTQNEEVTEAITDSTIDENETTIDEELHDIVYPGVDSTTIYEPPVIFTDTTIGMSNIEQPESRDELQTEEHIPHTLENVDVFGPEIQYTTDENGHTDSLPIVPNKVARHTTRNYLVGYEHNTEPFNGNSEYYTETPIIVVQSKFDDDHHSNIDSTETIYNMDSLKYFTELPQHHLQYASPKTKILDDTKYEISVENQNGDQDSVEYVNPYTEKHHLMTTILNNHGYTSLGQTEAHLDLTTLEPEVEIDPEIGHVYVDIKPNTFKPEISDVYKSNERETYNNDNSEYINPYTEGYIHITTMANDHQHDELDLADGLYGPTTLHSEIKVQPDTQLIHKWNLFKPKQKLSKLLHEELEPIKLNFKSNDKLNKNKKFKLPLTTTTVHYDEFENEELASEEIPHYDIEDQEVVTYQPTTEEYTDINYVQENQTGEKEKQEKSAEDNNYEANDEALEEDKYPLSKISSKTILHNNELSKKLALPGLPITSKPKITMDTIDALNRIIFGKAYDPAKGNKYKLPELSGVKPAPILLKPLEPHRYIPQPKFDLKLLHPAAPLLLPPPPPLPAHGPLHLSRSSRYAPPAPTSVRAKEDNLYRWFFSKFRSEDARKVADKVKNGEDLPVFEYKGSRIPYKIGNKRSSNQDDKE